MQQQAKWPYQPHAPANTYILKPLGLPSTLPFPSHRQPLHSITSQLSVAQIQQRRGAVQPHRWDERTSTQHWINGFRCATAPTLHRTRLEAETFRRLRGSRHGIRRNKGRVSVSSLSPLMGWGSQQSLGPHGGTQGAGSRVEIGMGGTRIGDPLAPVLPEGAMSPSTDPAAP